MEIISNSVINLSDSISEIQASLEELKESYQKVRAQATNAKMDRGRLADLEKMFLSLRSVLNTVPMKKTYNLNYNFSKSQSQQVRMSKLADTRILKRLDGQAKDARNMYQEIKHQIKIMGRQEEACFSLFTNLKGSLDSCESENDWINCDW